MNLICPIFATDRYYSAPSDSCFLNDHILIFRVYSGKSEVHGCWQCYVDNIEMP